MKTERKQPFGNEARKHLEKLLTSSVYQVRVEYNQRDRYGRILGTVFSDSGGDVLNGLMVRAGYAWAYRKYSEEYIPLEILARKERAGLWADANPVPPWEWRKRH